jgi:short-subunit dehydrogenase
MKTKSAIVTGASRGIGREIAKHLSLNGYDLLLISRTECLLTELKNEILSISPACNIETAAIDVFNFDHVNETVNSFHNKSGTIDLLFNNAGYAKRGTSEIDLTELSLMINSNLIGAINLIKAVTPIMKIKNSGYIINVCSRSAQIPRSFLGGYAATKAALLAYNESLYKELKETNLKVTALCPGFVDTEMTSDLKEDRSKLIKTSDICSAVDFLISLSPSAAMKTLSFESIVQIEGYC